MSRAAPTATAPPTTTMHVRRNRPGTKAAMINRWDWEAPATDTTTTTTTTTTGGSFSIQQRLQQLMLRLRKATTAHEQAELLCRLQQLPAGQDEAVWQYEHLRLFCIHLNWVVVLLQDCCRCVDMRAQEWDYLCAAHQTPQNCNARDYIVHTLDGSTTMLNSNTYFPSRISVPPTSVKHFGALARRLYRIFAHAWYHHLDVFGKMERELFLYQRFLQFCQTYNLIPAKLLVVPEDFLQQLADAESESGGISVGDSVAGERTVLGEEDADIPITDFTNPSVEKDELLEAVSGTNQAETGEKSDSSDDETF